MLPISDYLQRVLRDLPDSPGVYLMKDDSKAIIYVGKANSLKSRVRSYFQAKDKMPAKTAALVEKIADIETMVVNSPRDALILESNLIKEHRPRYNVTLRDDKHYPYIQLTTGEDFPRMLVSRRARNDGNRYFGPFVSVKSMRYAMSLIEKIFPLRNCANWQSQQRACLNAHIGRCPAPCEGRISKEEYAQIVEQVILFLQGKTKEILSRTEREMKQAGMELRFEDAARLRDQLWALQEVRKQQELDKSASGGNYDLLALAFGEDQCVVQVFFVRRGKVIGREHFFLNNVKILDKDEAEHQPLLIKRFLLDYYGDGEFIPSQIYLDYLPEDSEDIAAIFSERLERKVSFIAPKRGDKRRLLDLVGKNAQIQLNQYLQSRERQEEKNSAAVEDLRQRLNLSASPVRIECYDISHFQGSYTVGSMVVFQHGTPAPRLYRRFRIKTVEGIDDFASLAEVLRRRWQRGLDEREQGKIPPDFALFPDLLVIDGGKGQLSAACNALQELKTGRLEIISIAKREEEIFRPGESQPWLLPFDSPALHLLQHLRDEAHRFAIAYHRQLRGKGQLASQLDEIKGIGPARREKLLQAFGSVEGIKKASLEELSSVMSISPKIAEDIFRKLHENKQEGKNNR
ncbi:MAG: excinuclease ABC subunit UvrC [Clostridiales bacterium]|nr:excinuclease ABC subunit UvrC [Clostridiales bacterium]